jgi:hypothetical protein
MHWSHLNWAGISFVTAMVLLWLVIIAVGIYKDHKHGDRLEIPRKKIEELENESRTD